MSAGIVAIFLAVPAERRTLEDVARPFSAARNWVVQKRGVAAATH
jgi:hypothetical protein